MPDISRRFPALLSFWLPGLGQLWRCQWLKGVTMIVASFKSSQVAVDEAVKICASSGSPLRLALWLVLATAVWQWSVIDARRHCPEASCDAQDR